MAKISLTTRRWLIIAHIISASVHIGGVLCMLVLIAGNSPVGQQEIMKNIDISSGILVIVTGLLLCGLTSWGFFKHYWVIVKIILFGTSAVLGGTVLGPWIKKLIDLSGQMVSTQYLTIKNTVIMYHSITALMLFFLIAISVFKPWGRLRKAT